jgi:processive 1,2-diacylglycerol beta-glucosyltransferase
MRLELPRSRAQDASHRSSAMRGPGFDTENDPGPTRMLLLTSGLGLGHVRAAQGIEAAIDAALGEQAHVLTLDLWSLMNAGVARAVHATYLSLVQNHPELYERLYHLDERTWGQILESESGPPPAVLEVLELISGIAVSVSENVPRGGRYASDKMLLSLLCAALPYDGDSLAGNGVRARLALMKWIWLRLIRRLEGAIRKFSPDVIISTQMIPAAMASSLKERGKATAPLIGVMTDFGVHDFWRQRGVDRYCVAHESIVGSVRSGRAHAGAVATGVPLMPAFLRPISQTEARRELALPMDVPVVLIFGGGLGISVETAAATLLARKTGVHLLVMPGRNTSARAALVLLERAHRDRVRVCDWTDRMDVFLRASDLVVGKPGGISVAEALACGRPLLATRSLGGQEGFNVDFLERNDVGGLVPDSELLERVDVLLRDREVLHDMQRRAWLLGRRNGAAKVAELALDLVSARQAFALHSR